MIAETEFWRNIFSECGNRRIRLLLVDGRCRRRRCAAICACRASRARCSRMSICYAHRRASTRSAAQSRRRPKVSSTSPGTSSSTWSCWLSARGSARVARALGPRAARLDRGEDARRRERKASRPTAISGVVIPSRCSRSCRGIRGASTPSRGLPAARARRGAAQLHAGTVARGHEGAGRRARWVSCSDFTPPPTSHSSAALGCARRPESARGMRGRSARGVRAATFHFEEISAMALERGAARLVPRRRRAQRGRRVVLRAAGLAPAAGARATPWPRIAARLAARSGLSRVPCASRVRRRPDDAGRGRTLGRAGRGSAERRASDDV